MVSWTRTADACRQSGLVRMQLVSAASEATPFAKTGGLADVAGALPRELVKLGTGNSIPAILCARAQADRERSKGRDPVSYHSFSFLQPLCGRDRCGRAGQGAALLYRLPGAF